MGYALISSTAHMDRPVIPILGYRDFHRGRISLSPYTNHRNMTTKVRKRHPLPYSAALDESRVHRFTSEFLAYSGVGR